MTKGMEFQDKSDAQEAPEKGSQEVGETRAEPLEAPEVIKRVEQVTFDPEAVVQLEGDYMQAEAIQDAFVKVMEEPELAPAPGGLMPASIELELPEVQDVQPALSDASDLQPPTSGLPGLSEAGLETVGDGLVPLGESGISSSPDSSDQAGFLIGTTPTLEQALSVKPTLEAEIPEASVGEVRDVPIDPERIVTKPELGEAPRTPVVGTAEETMDLESFLETPETKAIEAVGDAKEAAAEVEQLAEARDAAQARYELTRAQYETVLENLQDSLDMLNMVLIANHQLPVTMSTDGGQIQLSNNINSSIYDDGYGTFWDGVENVLTFGNAQESWESGTDWVNAINSRLAVLINLSTANFALSQMNGAEAEYEDLQAQYSAAVENAEAAEAKAQEAVAAVQAGDDVLRQALWQGGSDGSESAEQQADEPGTSETEPPAEEGAEAEPAGEVAEDPSTDQPEDSQHNQGHGHDHG